MARYLLLKHYRGAPAPVNDVSMDRWKPVQEWLEVRPFLTDLPTATE
jgi:hypothetical protein